MKNPLNRNDEIGYLTNIFSAVIAALVANGLVFGLGWDVPDTTPRLITVPGILVGFVWLLLFGAMGWARWLLLPNHPNRNEQHRHLVLWLILFCLAYPFYAIAPGNAVLGIVGNLLTIAFALFVAWRVRRASPFATILIMPVALWVSFATLTFLPAPH